MSEYSEKRNFWKEEEENLLKQWADKAQCYQWMHSRGYNVYSRKNALFTIPVIIISTITGTANFAQERFSDDIKNYVVISIGTLSIIAGIITTVYQFLKIAELNEGHRVASLSWGKFYRNIKTELTRHPLDRTSPKELIKISRDEYDRLVELSPFMPLSIIHEFNTKFKKKIELTKPEICDELNTTNVFKMDEADRMKLISDLKTADTPKVNPEIAKKRKEIKKKMDLKTEQFTKTFYALNNRYPTKAEIDTSMKKFLTEEDEFIINQPEEPVVITIDDPVNFVKETNLDTGESNTDNLPNANENDVDDSDRVIETLDDNNDNDNNTPNVVENTL